MEERLSVDCKSLDDWQIMLRAAHDLAQASPNLMVQAGMWIDSEYSESAVRDRKERANKGESGLPASAYRMAGTEAGRDSRFWRLNCLGEDLRADPPDLSLTAFDDPMIWAARALLFVCLTTDRDAGRYLTGITELAELDWTGDEAANGLGRAWHGFDDLREGRAPWSELVRESLELVGRQPDQSEERAVADSEGTAQSQPPPPTTATDSSSNNGDDENDAARPKRSAGEKAHDEIASETSITARTQAEWAFLQAAKEADGPLLGVDLATKAGYADFRVPCTRLVRRGDLTKPSARGGYEITGDGRCALEKRLGTP